MKGKKAGIFSIIIILVLLAVLITILYFLYLKISDITAEPIPFMKNKTIDKNQASYSSSFQFYPNMRFPKKQIIYNINQGCSEEKAARVQEAFARLEQEIGLVKFYSNIYEDKADILISCEEMKEPAPGKYFIAGEGGPTEIINASRFYIIEKGKMLLLYKKSQCDNYNVELHEILHVLGFQHSNNRESIMYNITSCNQVLTNDISRELKRLYSIPELPDLYFLDVSAEKHGIYLDFYVQVRNQGLNKAGNIKLEVYAENEKIDEFSLEDINYGEGRILEVKNLKAGRNVRQIKFVLVSGEELEQENNIVELYLPES